MRTAMTLLALLTLAVAPACKKKDKTEPATTETGSGSATGSAAGSAAGSDTGSAGSAGSAAGSAAGSGSDTGSAGSAAGSAGSGAGSADAAMAHHAGNCPSTVLNSTTKAEVKGKAVVVTITSDDKDAIAAIQKRTTELLAEKKDGMTGDAHDQKGTHGGGAGLCPVYVPKDAKAEAKNDKKGAVVTITPKDKVDDLKKAVDERITKAADWVKANVKTGDQGNEGGVGGGKGDHGSNHSGEGDGKGKDRKKASSGSGDGGGKGTGGGGGKGTGGGDGKGSAKK
jgi:hypothetical protein